MGEGQETGQQDEKRLLRKCLLMTAIFSVPVMALMLGALVLVLGAMFPMPTLTLVNGTGRDLLGVTVEEQRTHSRLMAPREMNAGESVEIDIDGEHSVGDLILTFEMDGRFRREAVELYLDADESDSVITIGPDGRCSLDFDR